MIVLTGYFLPILAILANLEYSRAIWPICSANGLFWSFRQTQTRRTDGNTEQKSERSASPLYAPRAHSTTHH